jgi:aryl sulfotransferase
VRRIVWLASYPKSGNTWFRMLAANLRQDEPVDINDLPGDSDGGIASTREWFDNITLLPSGLLTHDECDRLRPRVYEAIARKTAEAGIEGIARVGGIRFVKTHDAWTVTTEGEPLLGGSKGAAGAILIVRDPRDVAASLANHESRTIDASITFMSDPGSAYCGERDRQPGQLRQQLAGWSSYNRSWLDQSDIPVHIVRYEDLQADAAGAFRKALGFAGIDATSEEAAQAARFADFEMLREQESKRGFREAPRNRPEGGFFRRGVSGGWRDELSPAQVARIEADHAAMMLRLGYVLSHLQDERNSI